MPTCSASARYSASKLSKSMTGVASARRGLCFSRFFRGILTQVIPMSDFKSICVSNHFLGLNSILYVYLFLSHPSDTLAVMRKIPLYQGKEQPVKNHVAASTMSLCRRRIASGKEQPVKNHVADAAADISSGSQVYEQQGAEGGTSNTLYRATEVDQRVVVRYSHGVERVTPSTERWRLRCARRAWAARCRWTE